MENLAVESNIFLIFGGTGDLSRRKLLPALTRLFASHKLHERCHVLAVGRSKERDDAWMRNMARKALKDAKVPDEQARALCKASLHYHGLGDGEAEDYRGLKDRVEALEKEHDLPGNRAFYLALPPTAFGRTFAGLSSAGLNKSRGFTRLVIEKPFGHDLASAVELNNLLHQHFDESQVYRIDHYLGKDTVQNLLVFRFANPLFESLWSRDRIDSVQITVAEDLGVGSRAGYYDKAGGAMRDMIQNHLTQVLSLVAMEVPVAYDANSIRFEKTKVLRSVLPPLKKDVVFGQYGRGKIGGTEVLAYREEEGIHPESCTETFAAMKLSIDTWRWQGVPFFLRSGKRLKRRTTQIAVRFKNAPVCLFQSMGRCMQSPNILLITLQPDEGFSLHFDVKTPGTPINLQRMPLTFKYREVFDDIPEAYETLLFDVLEGDQTLFVHADEVEHSWRAYAPIIDSPPEPHIYEAGSWGPKQADHLAIGEPGLWELR